VAVADAKLGDTSCESCHGPGSLHVKAGGSKSTIINPDKSPESCFQCHLDKRGQFSLPNAHPVMSGQVTCTECHDPHEGKAVKGTGASLHTQAESCTECHTAQKGPFIFKHNAMKEGCTACHNPHGSVNQKMLNAPDSNLCLQCHATGSSPGQLFAGGRDHAGNPVTGSCWVAGCHEAVHGSNVSHALRF
jgi:DmsE family decaheme c-type cytochrome